MTALPVATLHGAARTFGRGERAVVAIHDVTLEVFGDEHIAVVGPSGSGKSTLLHLLAGLDAPTHGTAEWPALGDHPRANPPGTVSVVFQSPSLLPALDVLENVALPLLLGGADETESANAAREALGRVGLRGIETRLPAEISAGQSQRVAVARALVAAPKLLIADEPTAHLDHASAETVIAALLDGAARAGAALVVATHDASVAARFPVVWTMADGIIDRAVAWSR